MWPIVRDAVASASPAVRRQIGWVLALWLGLIALQVWDSRNATGPAGVAEFVGAVLGASGVALLGTAHTLNRTLEESARFTRNDEPGIRQVLIALPGLGFAAGVALGAAAALMVLRLLLGVELLLAAVALTAYGAMLLFAARTVNGSARTLYLHATHHAALAADARRQAADAQVAALQARMNPHVLFNALNTVAAVVRTDPPAAERIVQNLADVLRTTLRRSAARTSTVQEEIDYVRAYLALEQDRLGDRLRVVWAVAEDVGSYPLPPLVLQPLVENALTHGIGSRAGGGTIRIEIDGGGDHVMLAVEDDGAGLPATVVERTGLGNLRERLATTYGGRASLMTSASPSGGARVAVRIPRP
jgi:signal transduction histidine kinase